MKLTPYWLDTAEPSGDYRRNPVPETVDVAIIGAGFTGLSAALEFGKQGASVAVLERHTVGWGASGRNGGMATTGLAIGFSTAVKRYGGTRAVEMFREYNDAIDTIEKLVHDNGIDCDYKRYGKLSLAFHPSHYEGMLKSQEQLATLADYHVTIIPKSEIHSEIGTDFYHGAMVDPLGAGLHVGKFVHGLAGAAADAGATLCENAAVTELKKVSGTVHDVHTTRGIVRAKQVLVATSGYTGSGHALAAAPGDPGGQLHHRHRAAAGRRGQPDPAQQAPGLGQQDAHLLLPDHPGQPAAVRGHGHGSRCPARTRTSRAARSCARRCWNSSRTSPTPRSTTPGAAWWTSPWTRWSTPASTTGSSTRSATAATACRWPRTWASGWPSYMGGDKSANVWEELKNPPVPGHFGPPWFLPFIGGAAKIIDRIS